MNEEVDWAKIRSVFNVSKKINGSFCKIHQSRTAALWRGPTCSSFWTLKKYLFLWRLGYFVLTSTPLSRKSQLIDNCCIALTCASVWKFVTIRSLEDFCVFDTCQRKLSLAWHLGGHMCYIPPNKIQLWNMPYILMLMSLGVIPCWGSCSIIWRERMASSWDWSNAKPTECVETESGG